MLSIAAELGNGLGHQDVEPIQTLGLVAVYIVVCLAENGADCQCRRIPEDRRPLAAKGLALGDMALARGPQCQQRLFVGERPSPPLRGPERCCDV